MLGLVNASATRRAAGGGRSGWFLLRVQQGHGGGLLGGRGIAPEQRERLVEHLLMFVAVDHDGAQRGACLGLRGEVDLGQRVLRGDCLGGTDGEAGAAQQPGEMHDICGEGGGGHQAAFLTGADANVV